MYSILSTKLDWRAEKNWQNKKSCRWESDIAGKNMKTGMTEKAGRLLLALFFDILQLHSDWHFRADYDYEIPS